MYKFSEEQSFEKLHLETQQIKNDINNQMISDRENLQTMANFAAKLYSEGQNFELLFDSFKEIGLFENIGILLPDNKFITKIGVLNLKGRVSFSDEILKGEYISGRVKDFTNDSREVVRSAVTIKTDDGMIVGILYGLINIEKLEDRYADDAASVGAQLCVLEGGNGNYIIDTKNERLGNVTALASSSYKKGFNYEKMISDLTEGKSGYSAFMSQSGDEYIYVHYAPLEFADWQIMLSQPEQIVFLGAKATSGYLTMVAMAIILIMIAYVALMFKSERKNARISFCASNIRKSLLGVNQQIDKIYEALKNIVHFSNARSAFVIGTCSEEYHYIMPSQKDKLLTGEEREYFNVKLLTYAARHRREHGTEVYLSTIKVNKQLRLEMPDFYMFVKMHDMHKVCFAVIVTNNSNAHVLGVINPKSFYVIELLKEIAVCFLMAIYNKRHLAKTEALALTDSLTGAANRMAYKNDIKTIDIRNSKLFACIYIDVNELHYFNDKYGHAAGDQMLVFIADVLRKEFSDSYVYRMGGDEFLIFTENLSSDVIESRIHNANVQIEEMKYHISIGIKYGDGYSDIEELVSEAEKLMYIEKARYYQNKELNKVTNLTNRTMESVETGINEIDACLAVMSVRYLGIFCVSHNNDYSRQILVPSYFSEILEHESRFSAAMRKYIHDIVKPEFHRTLLNFLEYDVLERELKNGRNPKASYVKIDGERITLSIHSVSESRKKDIDSIWIFEKEEI